MDKELEHFKNCDVRTRFLFYFLILVRDETEKSRINKSSLRKLRHFVLSVVSRERINGRIMRLILAPGKKERKEGKSPRQCYFAPCAHASKSTSSSSPPPVDKDVKYFWEKVNMCFCSCFFTHFFFFILPFIWMFSVKALCGTGSWKPTTAAPLLLSPIPPPQTRFNSISFFSFVLIGLATLTHFLSADKSNFNTSFSHCDTSPYDVTMCVCVL